MDIIEGIRRFSKTFHQCNRRSTFTSLAHDFSSTFHRYQFYDRCLDSGFKCGDTEISRTERVQCLYNSYLNLCYCYGDFKCALHFFPLTQPFLLIEETLCLIKFYNTKSFHFWVNWLVVPLTFINRSTVTLFLYTNLYQTLVRCITNIGGDCKIQTCVWYLFT